MTCHYLRKVRLANDKSNIYEWFYTYESHMLLHDVSIPLGPSTVPTHRSSFLHVLVQLRQSCSPNSLRTYRTCACRQNILLRSSLWHVKAWSCWVLFPARQIKENQQFDSSIYTIMTMAEEKKHPPGLFTCISIQF